MWARFLSPSKCRRKSNDVREAYGAYILFAVATDFSGELSCHRFVPIVLNSKLVRI